VREAAEGGNIVRSLRKNAVVDLLGFVWATGRQVERCQGGAHSDIVRVRLQPDGQNSLGSGKIPGSRVQPRKAYREIVIRRSYGKRLFEQGSGVCDPSRFFVKLG
jgi:hypothetical protein